MRTLWVAALAVAPVMSGFSPAWPLEACASRSRYLLGVAAPAGLTALVTLGVSLGAAVLHIDAPILARNTALFCGVAMCLMPWLGSLAWLPGLTYAAVCLVAADTYSWWAPVLHPSSLATSLVTALIVLAGLGAAASTGGGPRPSTPEYIVP